MEIRERVLRGEQELWARVSRIDTDRIGRDTLKAALKFLSFSDAETRFRCAAVAARRNVDAELL